jgi:hypothetical protein
MEVSDRLEMDASDKLEFVLSLFSGDALRAPSERTDILSDPCCFITGLSGKVISGTREGDTGSAKGSDNSVILGV